MVHSSFMLQEYESLSMRLDTQRPKMIQMFSDTDIAKTRAVFWPCIYPMRRKFTQLYQQFRRKTVVSNDITNQPITNGIYNHNIWNICISYQLKSTIIAETLNFGKHMGQRESSWHNIAADKHIQFTRT